MGGTVDLQRDRSLRIRRLDLALVLFKLRSKFHITDGETEAQRKYHVGLSDPENRTGLGFPAGEMGLIRSPARNTQHLG